MSGLNVKDVFCEILSGFAFIFSLIPALDLLKVLSLDKLLLWINTYKSGALVGVIVMLAYILGLLMDAVGLTIGESLLDDLLCKDGPTKEAKARFFEKASEHIMSYRNTQWAFFSAYRNLFIILIPGGIFWIIFISTKFKFIHAVLVGILIVQIEFALYRSMKALLELYYEITKSYWKSSTFNNAPLATNGNNENDDTGK